MRKLKLLLAVAALFGVSTAWAQTDVTSTYLTNADFSQGTLASPAICTYAKDKSGNNTDYANLVDLDGWTAQDNGDGKAGGPVAIGSGVWVGGSGYTAPPTNSDGEVTGNVLGIVGCWSASAQYTQNLKVEMPAGTYTIVLAVYNSKGGTNAVDKNLIGFVETGGTEHYAETKQYPVNTWKYEFITFTLDAPTSGYVSLGYKSTNTGSGNMPHLFISGLEIYEGEIDAEAYEAAKTAIREAKEAKVLWDIAKADADKALADAAYANVIGVEKANLEAEVAKAEPTTAEGYRAATKDLTDATTAFTAAKTSYDAVPEANALATKYSLTPIEVTSSSTAAEIAAAIEEINAAVKKVLQGENVALFNDVETNYPYKIELNSWTTTGNVKTEKGQHWNGDAAATYNEPDYWSSNSGGTSTWTQDMTLPAGSYYLKIAGRRSGSSSLTVSVKQGEVELVSDSSFPAQDSGYGIDTDGKANFSDEGNYANENKGRGFEWRMLKFTLAEEGAVTIAVEFSTTVKEQWASFCNYVIKAQNEKAVLMGAISAAKAVKFGNIGTGAFQKNTTAASDLETAIAAAKDVYDNSASTAEQVSTAIKALNKAVDDSKKAYNNTELNAPADGQLFNVILTYEGYQYDNKAVTYLAGDRTDMGNYNIKYNAPANKNLAQAFTFTKVSGNNYKMSQIDAEGNVRYVCTGVPYNGNTSQIRTTTNVDDALEVTIIPTETEGVYNLKNTEADNFIGSQDAGFYTVNSHIDFKIVETTKPAITINTTAAGWGTVILPFVAATLPENVKAYTCAELKENGTTLELVEVNTLEANKPYIIEGAWNDVKTGDALGINLSYTEGLLTGVYAEQKATKETYVLQKNDGVVGFYHVAEGSEPTISANHAYLTVPTPADGGTAREAYFFGSETTGIMAIEALTSGNATIFNAAGAQIPALQKGMNIVRKADGKSYKVIVK